MYLVSASLKFKDYIECTLKIILKWLSKISDPFTSKPKVSNWWHFIYSWRDLTPLLHVHLEITTNNLVNLDAIKASVPKFFNFLGAGSTYKSWPKIEGNPSTGWNLKINFKSHKTLFVPKVKNVR